MRITSYLVCLKPTLNSNHKGSKAYSGSGLDWRMEGWCGRVYSDCNDVEKHGVVRQWIRRQWFQYRPEIRVGWGLVYGPNFGPLSSPTGG